MDALNLAIARSKLTPRGNGNSPPKQEPKPDETAKAIRKLMVRIILLEEKVSDLVNRPSTDDPPLISPSVDAIKRLLCMRSGITGAQMVSVSHAKHITWPRQIAMYLCTRLIPTLSTPQIGRLFGGRDHTTVLHARNKVAAMRASDAAFAAGLADLEARFQPAAAGKLSVSAES